MMDMNRYNISDEDWLKLSPGEQEALIDSAIGRVQLAIGTLSRTLASFEFNKGLRNEILEKYSDEYLENARKRMMK